MSQFLHLTNSSPLISGPVSGNRSIDSFKFSTLFRTRTFKWLLLFSLFLLKGFSQNVQAQCAGYALKFDSSNFSYVNPAANITSVRDSFTIEFWVKPNKTIPGSMTESNGYYDFTGTSGQNYAIYPIRGGNYPDTATVGVSVGTNGVAVFEHAVNYMPALLVYYTSLSSTSWTHIAVVYSNKTPHLYINGSYIKSGVNSYINTLFPSSQLGDGSSYGPFSGTIDELRIWEQPLSATTISNWYTKLTLGSHPNRSILYTHWKLDEGTGTTVYDSSGNGHNGTRNSSLSSPVLPAWVTPGFFTVADTIKPTITCPGNITKDMDAGGCGAIINYSVTANDNCPGYTVTQTSGLASGKEFPVGTTVNTFVVTDAQNNTATCSFSVTVIDTVRPTISCPGDMTVSNDRGVCGAEINYAVTYWDNCPNATVTQVSGMISSEIFPIGTTVNKFIIRDAGGFVDSCSFSVTVVDDERPVLSCPGNISVNNDNGKCGATVNFTVSGSDNCPNYSIVRTSGLASGSDFPIGTTTNTYIITDASGNKDTCSFTVTVTDNQKPTLTCVGNQTRSTNTGVCTYTVSGTEFDPTGFADNCPNATISNNFNNSSSLAGAVFNKGTTTVVWTVTDASNNKTTCSYTVTVNDNQNPTISCVGNQTRPMTANQCYYKAVGTEFDPTSYGDNCAGATIKNDYNNTATLAGDIFLKGTTTVRWTITDASNNKTSCVFTITVNDNQNPTISCVSNQTKSTNPNTCTYTVSGTEFNPVAYSDNCPSATIKNDYNGNASLAGAVFNKGTTTVNWIVTDASNNKDTCTFTVTVNDNQNPTITCVGNQTRNTDNGKCSYQVSGTEFNPTNFNDNCPGATIKNNYNNSASLAGAIFPKGTTTVVWTVTDASSNTASCSFNVTVNDNQNPTVTCVSNQTRSTDAGKCSYTVSGSEFNPSGYSDNCGIKSVTNNITGTATLAGALFSKGTTNVIWTVKDSANNTSTCSFNVTVNDNESPSISCVSNQTRNTDNNKCSYTVNGSEFNPTGYSDNCGIKSVTNNITGTSSLAGALFKKGTTTVIWTATDSANNTKTCSFNVTVNDNQAPSISCVSNQNRNTDAGKCTYAVSGSEFDPTSYSDNCGIKSISNNITGTASLSGAILKKGTNNITWTAVDSANNVKTCSFSVTVNDNQNPTITCKSNQTRNTDAGKCSYTAAGTEFDPSGFGDNCGVKSVTNSRTGTSSLAGALFPKGTTTVTWTVTDSANNTATCSFTVTVNDNEKPTLTCPSNATLNVDAGKCSRTIASGNFTNYRDNCGVKSVVNSHNGLSTLTGAIFPKGVTTVTWTVTDSSNNSATCSFTVTVVDNQAPTVTCVGNQTRSTDAGKCSYTVSGTEFNPTGMADNCGIKSVTNNITGTNTLAGAVLKKGTTTVIWTVSDTANNTATCSFTVTVNDNQNPTITCVSAQTRSTNTGTCTYTTVGTEFNPTTADNCGVASVTNNYNNSSSLAGALFKKGTTTVVWTVKDSANNQQTCSVNITVTDNENPTITCPSNQTKNADAGLCTYTVSGSQFDPTFSDNCPKATIKNNFTNTSTLDGAVFDVGQTTVTWTVTDSSNNTATCNFTVNIIDNQNPTISCVGNQTRNTDAGTCTYTVVGTEFNPTAYNDNCPGATISNNFNNSSTLANAKFPKGTTVVVWTISDASNNTDTCNFTVTVNDNEAPVISCVGNQTRPTDAGICTYQVSGTEFDPVSFSDNCPGATITNNFNYSSSLANAIFPEGGTAVTWTVTDANNNTSTCSFVVTIEDQEDPIINCPGSITRSTDPGKCSYTSGGGEGDPTYRWDNCLYFIQNDYDNKYYGTLDSVVFPKGTTTVTWTITDIGNNTATCSFDVTVNDNESPTVSCVSNQTRSTDAGTCTYTTVGTEFDVTGTSDNCGVASVTNNYTGTASLAGAVFSKGTTTVTWTVKDSANNTSTCSFTVTVNDNENPTITCVSNQTRSTDAGTCTYTTVGTEFNPTTADNCGVASVTNNYTGTASLAGAVFSKGATTVTWTVKDSANNTSTCSFTVTVNDNEAPKVTCVSNQTRSTNVGKCSYTTVGTEFNLSGVTDNCGIKSITNSHNGASTLAGAIFKKGTTSVTWTVKDTADNTTTCSFTVTVNDNEAPKITCPANATFNVNTGLCSRTIISASFPSHSDNCGIKSISNNINGANTLTGVIFPKGITTVVWTVKDSADNTTTCSFTVTVNDNEAPKVTCVGNQTRSTSPGNCTYTTVGNEFNPNATDNCGIASISNNYNSSSTLAGAVFNPGTTNVIWTVRDTANNVTTCTTAITVRITEINVTGNGNTIADGDVTPSTADHTDFGGILPNVSTPRTYTIENTGNDTLRISSINIGGTNAADFTLGGISLPTTVSPGASKTFTVTFVASTIGFKYADVTINNNDCNESVYNYNLQAEIICTMPEFTTCPGNITRGTRAGNCDTVVTYSNAFTGLPTPTLTYSFSGATTGSGSGSGSGSSFNKGVTTVRLIASNICGNDTCTFTITVTDIEDPTITCVGNQTRSTDAGSCTYTVIGTEFNPSGYNDNCPGAVITNDYNNSSTLSGAVFNKGTTTVTWTVTDAVNRTTTCSFDVTINDNEKPVIANCPSNRSANNDPGVCEATVTYTAPTATDNCSGVTITRISGLASGSKFPGGVTVVTYVAVDGSGNTDTCRFTVTVNDTEVPNIVCKNKVVNANTSLARYTVIGSELDPLIRDNCGLESLKNSLNGSNTLQGYVFTSAITTVTWVGKDISGNKDSCSYTVTVVPCGKATPTGTNTFTGNKVLRTQTDVDNFYNTGTGTKYTKVTGDVTIEYLSTSTPAINNLCNLEFISEIGGHLKIQDLDHNANPQHLTHLESLVSVGRLTIQRSSRLRSVSLPNLETVNGNILIAGNPNATAISFPKLKTCAGSTMNIRKNFRAAKINFSDQASSFRFTGGTSSLLVTENGDSVSGTVTIDFKKVTRVRKDLTFEEHHNSSVTNFDNIFTGLDSVDGVLKITNNTYLSKCCVAATAVVKKGKRIISGNTGNCADTAAVLADCGAFSKRNGSLSANDITIHGFNVYPSPNRGSFTVELDGISKGNIKISVMDMMGKVIYTDIRTQGNTHVTEIPVNVDFASDGQYMVKVEVDNKVFVNRVVLIK